MKRLLFLAGLALLAGCDGLWPTFGPPEPQVCVVEMALGDSVLPPVVITVDPLSHQMRCPRAAP